MNRRELLKTLPLAVVVPSVQSARKRWGELTVERHWVLKRHGIDLRVIHNGDDVTDRCCFADDTGDGYADVYTTSPPRLKPDRLGPDIERLYGIQFVEGKP